MMIRDGHSLMQAIEAFLSDHNNIESTEFREEGLNIITDDGEEFMMSITWHYGVDGE